MLPQVPAALSRCDQGQVEGATTAAETVENRGHRRPSLCVCVCVRIGWPSVRLVLIALVFELVTHKVTR